MEELYLNFFENIVLLVSKMLVMLFFDFFGLNFKKLKVEVGRRREYLVKEEELNFIVFFSLDGGSVVCSRERGEFFFISL